MDTTNCLYQIYQLYNINLIIINEMELQYLYFQNYGDNIDMNILNNNYIKFLENSNQIFILLSKSIHYIQSHELYDYKNLLEKIRDKPYYFVNYSQLIIESLTIINDMITNDVIKKMQNIIDKKAK
jgi:hypothetical protein